MILDQYDDVNGTFLKKIANVGIIIDKKEDVSELPDKDFALIIVKNRKQRKFPICDPKTTILSLMYFLKNMDNMHEPYIKTAGANLKEACVKYEIDIPSRLDRFSIGTESNIVTQDELIKSASLTEEDLPDSEFGLITKEARLFPMHNKEHVLKAIKYYPDAKEKLAEDEAQKLKQAIEKKAQKFGIELEKEAKVNPNLMRDMKFRIRNLTSEQQKPYIKLAKIVEENKVKIKEASVVLNRLDKQNNFHPGYMKNVLTEKEYINKFASIEEFSNNMEKTADAKGTSQTIIELLQNDDKKTEFISKLKEKFANDIVENLKQDPETIYNSLPEPHQNIIENVIDEVRG